MKTHLGLSILVLLSLLGWHHPTKPALAAASIHFQDGAFPTAEYTGARDTYLNESLPLNNYGTATTLYSDGDDPAEADYAHTESAVLLGWDVSAIAPGSRVTGVQIKLYINVRSQRAWPVYALYRAWNESQANWLRPDTEQFWYFSGTRSIYDRSTSPVATIPAQAAVGFITVPLNPDGVQMVQQWVNQPERNHGVVVAEWLNAVSRMGAASSEATAVERRPMLLVAYEPPAAANTPPVAEAMALSTPEDTDLSISPAGTDDDDDPLVYRVITPPAKGQILPLGTGFIYRPNLHAAGTDSFTYAASDGQAESSPEQVTIDVQAENDPPFPIVTANVWNGVAPLAVSLSGSVVDVDALPGAPFTYSWDYGDGATGQGAAVAHTFSAPGIYPVKLTATDDDGAAGETTYVITVRDPDLSTARPNVILFIGDGMGIEHVRAAGMFGSGREGTLLFERFQHQALMETRSASTQLTDSAAAATAMATGVKVKNEVISLAIPGDGSELFTVLEAARERGMSTGLVTTNNVTDATPAGFAAHTGDRNNEAEIAQDYLTQTRPNILFGSGAYGMTQQAAIDAGYQVVTNLTEMMSLDMGVAEYVSGQFGSKPLPYESEWTGDRPHLAEMTETALRILDNNPNGFFLMVEDENIDRASHIYDLPKMVSDVLELERAVAKAVTWAKTHPNTMIVVLADHETSGLVLQDERGKGNYPDAGWTVLNHTGQDVKVYATGVWADQVGGRIDNTQIAAILQGGTFNHPPSVSAGSDLSALVDVPVVLSGAASDDGFPQGSALTYQWSVVAGDADMVEVETPESVSPRVVFRAEGSYILRLTASDGEFSRSDMLVVQATVAQPTETGMFIFIPIIQR